MFFIPNPTANLSDSDNKCHDLAKWLSHYLIFFSFSFLLFFLSMDMQDKSDS